MRELFVYYRVRETDAAAMGSAVQGMQATLCAGHPGLIARVMRRPDATNGLQTWMEVYAVDPSAMAKGIDRALQAAIEAEAQALSPWLAGPRHTEVFIACAPEFSDAQSARVISTCAMPASSNTGPAGTKPARA